MTSPLPHERFEWSADQLRRAGYEILPGDGRVLRAHQHQDGRWFFCNCHPHDVSLWIDDAGVHHVDHDSVDPIRDDVEFADVLAKVNAGCDELEAAQAKRSTVMQVNEQQQRGSWSPTLIVVAVVALLAAVALYAQEQDKTAPNNGPSLLLAGVGAFLILIAAILSAGQRRP